MSYETGELQEQTAALDSERQREAIVERAATEIANSVQTLLTNATAEAPTSFWDDSEEGKKRYMALLLHEAMNKLGLSADEVKEVNLDNIW